MRLTLDTGDTVEARVDDVDRVPDERLRVALESAALDGRLKVTANRLADGWHAAHLQRSTLEEPTEDWAPVGEVIDAVVVGTAPR
ncbi:hypothetical protein [Halegenticoccus tardaugens]|uniref:hypothetical protein n=1 Tax=Halegenticoccus tardaugens TaxID=2071624 RepID=UPI00100B23BA|nr:hypothetical protein [Halegenticoccus tardaugens]